MHTDSRFRRNYVYRINVDGRWMEMNGTNVQFIRRSQAMVCTSIRVLRDWILMDNGRPTFAVGSRDERLPLVDQSAL